MINSRLKIRNTGLCFTKTKYNSYKKNNKNDVAYIYETIVYFVTHDLFWVNYKLSPNCHHQIVSTKLSLPN